MAPMLLDLGSGEIAIVVAIALLLFGGSRLAGLGKSAGRAIKEFKAETSGLSSADPGPAATATRPDAAPAGGVPAGSVAADTVPGGAVLPESAPAESVPADTAPATSDHRAEASSAS